MKKKLCHILLPVCLIIIVFVVPTQAVSADTPDPNSRFMIELINWIRLDPVSYAAGLGYDGETLLQERPWLAILIKNELPMLEITAYQDAKAAMCNMPISIDTVPEPSVSDDSARTGEISGIVSFQNFMEPRDAVRIVVNNQFKAELDPGFQGQRCILSTEFDLAGAAFEAGTDFSGEITGNAYYLTATLGSSVLKSQRQILNLINQVRANPAEAGVALSLNLDAYSGGYAPLFFNGVLEKFVKTDYINTDDYAIHAENFGYGGYGINRSSVIDIFPKTDVNTKVSLIFSSLVLNEANGFTTGNVIFGRYYNEAGINLQFVDGPADDYAMLTFVTGLGKEENPEYSRIYGLVYIDANIDGAYTPGEGVENRIISIYDRQTFAKVKTARTDKTGHFSATLLCDKEYIIQTGSGDNLAGRDLFLGNTDAFFDLRLVE